MLPFSYYYFVFILLVCIVVCNFTRALARGTTVDNQMVSLSSFLISRGILEGCVGQERERESDRQFQKAVQGN